MSIQNRTAALLAGAALVAVPSMLAVASPASADVERRGSCGGGTYEISADREGAGYEVSVDLDRVEPGSRWRVTVRHDGSRIARKVLRADHEGDVDLDRRRPNTSGKETFSFRAKRVGSNTSCGGNVTIG